MEILRSLGQFNLTVFMDGSTEDGVLLDWSAAVVMKGNPNDVFRPIDTLRKEAGCGFHLLLLD